MRVLQFFKSLLTVERGDRIKLLCLSGAFFLIIGAYTVTRTLKDTLFVSIVGRGSIPIAKMCAIVMLIPGVLIFSKLVDVVRRYQLIYIYSLFFGIGGFVIAYFLGHPTIGLPNTVPSSGRIFGWAIYLFVEGINPFLVSVFWSFAHSITTPQESKTNYPIMVASSKFGGLLSALFGCWMLGQSSSYLKTFSDIAVHQLLLSVVSSLLLFVPVIIYLLMHKVPRRHMHGYEAAYQAEKRQRQEDRQDDGLKKEKASFLASLYNLFSGLIFLCRYPYALGMFGIVFFWEVINSFVSFERLAVNHATIAERTIYLLQQDFIIHSAGLIIVLIGTRALVELIGERKSLILVPLVTGVLLTYYFSAQSAASMAVVYVMLRVMNYAFAVPLRERLYTPTVKEIQFKSKLWIDSFGVKLAKGAGSGYNIFIMGLSQASQVSVGLVFFSSIVGCWAIISNYMGRAFERAVSRNKVIGLDS